MKEFVVEREQTLRAFTDNTYAQASFCFRALLARRDIRVNGVRTGEDVLLRAGDTVRYYTTPSEEGKTAFAVLYEDGHILVCDKESGVNSEAVFSALREKGAVPVHRLDRNTEGLLLFAKDGEAEEELLRCFRERRIEKRYLALVFGKMETRGAVLHAYLQKDGKNSRVFVSEKGAGEEIVTEYRVLEERGETSLLLVTLHTGKTHQIRAHLAHIGHPVVGDEKYGDSRKNAALHAARQKLVAKELVLHPRGLLSYLDGKTFVSQKNL